MSRNHRVALVTAVDAEVPVSNESSVLDVVRSSGLFDDIIVALPPGQHLAAEFARSKGVEVFEGEAENVALRLLRALGRRPKSTIVARFMLRAFWADPEIVKRTLLRLESTTSIDYVTYARNVNYTFGCDAFTFTALQRVIELTQAMPSGIARSTFEFSPWAMMEIDDSFDVAELSFAKTYDIASAERIRAQYALALGPGENQHGGSSATSPSSRYLWASGHLRSDMYVCEIAAGQGGGTQFLSGFCREIVGIEPDKAYVDRARSGFHAPTFLEGTSSRLREFGQRFDAVVSLHTLEHVPDDEEFLRDIHGSLVDNGVLILEVPLLLPIPLGMPLLPFHDREYILEDLLGLVGSAGFSVVRTWGVCRNMYVDAARAREAIALVARRRRR